MPLPTLIDDEYIILNQLDEAHPLRNIPVQLMRCAHRQREDEAWMMCNPHWRMSRRTFNELDDVIKKDDWAVFPFMYGNDVRDGT